MQKFYNILMARLLRAETSLCDYHSLSVWRFTYAMKRMQQTPPLASKLASLIPLIRSAFATLILSDAH
jgi:hypothetical protein